MQKHCQDVSALVTRKNVAETVDDGQTTENRERTRNAKLSRMLTVRSAAVQGRTLEWNWADSEQVKFFASARRSSAAASITTWISEQSACPFFGPSGGALWVSGF